MQRVLVLIAYPGQRHSQTNCLLSQTAVALDDITFVDLYAEYPRFKINIDTEQQRLLEHDVIVFQFPIHWYSAPSLLKVWQDLMLEYGFAYGPGGDKLAGKTCLLAVTAGAPANSYREGAMNRFALRTLLSPCSKRFIFVRLRIGFVSLMNIQRKFLKAAVRIIFQQACTTSRQSANARERRAR